MMNQTNIATKSILAKLLATENIRVEHNAKASTASFDLKNRVLTCPVWDAMDGDMYDMLLGHEISHAKHTPAEGWHTAIVSQNKKQGSYKHFLNVIEDARIEKLIKRQYPGLRKPFFTAYRSLHERDLFQTKGKNLSKLYFIDRVNLHCKMGFIMNIKFTAQERALLSMVENAESWQDVVDATNKIWEYSKQEQKEDQEKQKQKLQDMSETLSNEPDDEEEDSDSAWDDEDGDEDGESWDSDDSDDESEDDEDGESEDGEEDADGLSDDDQDAEGEESDDLKGNGKSEDSEEEKDKEEKEEEKEEKGSRLNREKDSFDPDSNEDFIPQASTDEAFRKNEMLLNAKNAPQVRYVNLPTANLENIITPAKKVNAQLQNAFTQTGYSADRMRGLYEKFQAKNSTFITSLAKEFEMKKAAKSYAKAKISESGDINISKLGLFRTEDDIFKKVTILHKGKSHGLVLLLDKSGSMRGNMAGAIEQILVLASFCRKVNIPFVAYGFTNRNYILTGKSLDSKLSFVQEEGAMKLSNMGLREIINSNMKLAEFTQAIMNHLALAEAYESYDSRALDILDDERLQNTPLNEALVAMLPIIKQFKTARKLDLVNLVIVHDGDADYTNTYYLNGLYPERFETQTERVYLRDRISGAEVQAPVQAGYRGVTVGLMDMLRKVCEIGIYGFYIGGKQSDIQNYYTSKDGESLTVTRYEDKTMKKLEAKNLSLQLNREKFLESWTPGYNRFYFLPDGRNLKVTDAPIVIKGSVTARKLSSAFIKQGKAKYSNRVLVSRFIEGIAK